MGGATGIPCPGKFYDERGAARYRHLSDGRFSTRPVRQDSGFAGEGSGLSGVLRSRLSGRRRQTRDPEESALQPRRCDSHRVKTKNSKIASTPLLMLIASVLRVSVANTAEEDIKQSNYKGANQVTTKPSAV